MRHDDPKQANHSRTRSRIAKGDNGWIVRTREGTRGPFASEAEAWAYASVYRDTTQFLDQSADAFSEEIDPSKVEVIEMTLPRWC